MVVFGVLGPELDALAGVRVAAPDEDAEATVPPRAPVRAPRVLTPAGIAAMRLGTWDADFAALDAT